MLIKSKSRDERAREFSFSNRAICLAAENLRSTDIGEDGDSVRAGGEGLGGARRVLGDGDERQRGRQADSREDSREQRHERLLLSGSLHLPCPPYGWPHRPLYGRRSRRK